MGCYVYGPMKAFGIYLTSHPQHWCSFSNIDSNTIRGDGPMRVFGIYLTKHPNSGVRFPNTDSNIIRGRILFFEMLIS